MNLKFANESSRASTYLVTAKAHFAAGQKAEAIEDCKLADTASRAAISALTSDVSNEDRNYLDDIRAAIQQVRETASS